MNSNRIRVYASGSIAGAVVRWRWSIVAAVLLLGCLYQVAAAQNTAQGALAATYYISPGGNDTAAGVSTSTAWRTFNRAWQTLMPGDTLLLLDGTYIEPIEPDVRDGQAGKPITVKALNDGKVTIDGQGVRKPLVLAENSAIGHWFVIEGIVLRNGTEHVAIVKGNNNVLRRVSAYDANTNVNSQPLLLWGSNNLVEDCLVGGTGRFMIDMFQSSGNTVRRCFVKWSGWDGKNFCGVTWPNSYMIGVYNSSNSTIENSIAYGRGVTGIIVQANASNVSANNNHVLGSMSLLMGKDYNGSVWNYGTYPKRPGPTDNPYGSQNCDNSVTDWTWPGQRVGFQLFGQGTLENNVFRDILAANNAGLGFSVNNPGGVGDRNTVLDHATLYGNGSEAPSSDGGKGAQMARSAGVTMTNSRIGSTSQGADSGARFAFRYVNRTLTNEPLLPWPMEARAVSELGVSINAIVTSAIDQGGGSTTPFPTPAATSSPSTTPTKTPAPSATPTTAVVPTNTPAATATPGSVSQNGLRVNVPLINAAAGDPALDANHWAILSVGKLSPSGGYTQMRLAGIPGGVRVYVQTMTPSISGSFTLQLGQRVQTVTYKTTAGWEFGERCGSGTTNCRGWTASALIPWSEFGGQPAAGVEWALSLGANGNTWSGTLRWGLPDYAGRAVAGAQTVTLPLSGDSMLGGGTDCGSLDSANYFGTWGNRNWAASPYVNVQSQWDTADWPCYAKYYANWSLASLPVGAQVVSATVEMRHFGNPGYGGGYAENGSKDTVIQVYEVDKAWQETTITWDNAPVPVENVSRTLVKPIDITCGGKSYCSPGIAYKFDVTAIVQRAVAGGRNWASMSLYTAAGQYHSGKYFSSREGGEPPIVRITYVVSGSMPTATQAAPTATPAAPTATPAAPTPAPTSATVAFPVVKVLDTFNRANGTLGTNWGGSTSGYRVASQNLDIGTTRDIFWKATKFGANQEAYVTLTSIDPSATQMGVLLKAQSNLLYTGGVIEVFYSPVQRNLQLWTYTSARGWVRNATSFGVTFSNGDRLGVRAYADGKVGVWRNSTPIGMWIVTNWPYYKAGGYVGVYTYNAKNGMMDEFGGGTISADPYNPTGLVEDEPGVDIVVSAPALQSGPDGARYLVDSTGSPVYMAGAVGSFTMQPAADGVVFDYASYLDMAASSHLNAVRLWSWQTAPWMSAAPGGGVDQPYRRAGEALAADGKPQFDLNQFDQAYFDRLRQAAIEADSRGLYVVVELFNSRGLEAGGWAAQPFAGGNNSNGVDGDTNDDGAGLEMATLADPALIALQDAFVRKTVATLHDLDNVLYQVSDEQPVFPLDWKLHMLQVIGESDQQSTVRHTAGAYAASDAEVAVLRSAGANWVTAAYADNQAVAPAAVFAVSPVDVMGDRSWAWKSLMRGYNIVAGVTINDPAVEPAAPTLMANLGDLRAFAQRIGVANLTPRNELCSTGYCLANQSTGAASYVVYAPEGGLVSVDLSASPGTLFYEWIDPATGKSEVESSVEGGGVQSLAAPFAGDAVLYIYSAPDLTQRLFLPAIFN